MLIPRIIKLTLLNLVTMILPLVWLAVCLFVPFNCDPSRDPELDKPLYKEYRNLEMDPAAAKTVVPGAGRHLIKPSEVWKN